MTGCRVGKGARSDASEVMYAEHARAVPTRN
jgi:hypothetical protein